MKISCIKVALASFHSRNFVEVSPMSASTWSIACRSVSFDCARKDERKEKDGPRNPHVRLPLSSGAFLTRPRFRRVRHTTAVSAAGGDACDTRSNQDCRCLASEEVELSDVIVLTGDDSEPLALPATVEE
ncbi:hypothetical protein EYF80_006660 [Liparis tanakae]|uniref:Uncharacterized protein n=1 Tax=Liparis tanakae TaxID=230148 RepID=A0A4Z2J0R8_9TELE|nr:hypothetical protein EYF80_006660 [Liparis tanakae]